MGKVSETMLMNSNISVLSVTGAVCYSLCLLLCLFCKQKGESSERSKPWEKQCLQQSICLVCFSLMARKQQFRLCLGNNPFMGYGKRKILKYLSSCLPTASCKSSVLHADTIPCLTLGFTAWWDKDMPGRCWASWLGRLESQWCCSHIYVCLGWFCQLKELGLPLGGLCGHALVLVSTEKAV